MIKEKKGELKKNCCKTTILSLRAKLVDAPSIGGDWLITSSLHIRATYNMSGSYLHCDRNFR